LGLGLESILLPTNSNPNPDPSLHGLVQAKKQQDTAAGSSSGRAKNKSDFERGDQGKKAQQDNYRYSVACPIISEQDLKTNPSSKEKKFDRKKKPDPDPDPNPNPNPNPYLNPNPNPNPNNNMDSQQEIAATGRKKRGPPNSNPNPDRPQNQNEPLTFKAENNNVPIDLTDS
jgi:hypothetical protein